MFFPTRPRPGRRALALVETAVVLSATLLLMLAVFEFGRLVMIKQIMDNAAREGARAAVVSNSTGTTASVQAVVTKYLAGQQLSNVQIQVYQINPATQQNVGSWNSAGFNQSIAVQVNATYTVVAPLPGVPTTLSLQSRAVMTCEGN